MALLHCQPYHIVWKRFVTASYVTRNHQRKSLYCHTTPPEIQAAYAIPSERCAVPADRTDWSEWLLAYDEAAPASPQSPGSFIYTSGTTGHPRAVKRAAQTREQAERSNVMVARAFGLS